MTDWIYRIANQAAVGRCQEDQMKKKKSGISEATADAWGKFLDARKLLIDCFLADGQSPDQIAGTLSMDAEQVRLIGLWKHSQEPAE